MEKPVTSFFPVVVPEKDSYVDMEAIRSNSIPFDPVSLAQSMVEFNEFLPSGLVLIRDDTGWKICAPTGTKDDLAWQDHIFSLFYSCNSTSEFYQKLEAYIFHK